MTKEELENLIVLSRKEVYLKYLSGLVSEDYQNFITSDLEAFITSENQKFKVKVI